ncbi:aminoglycoside phosphotransferase family protein [Kitasatospora sp. NPDC057223]|uniref:aminoglycoside phosphotransferase family protein n=1 Tax=Kitasatospora sp. NPDC057223 TaxID=3346055 RepID=UPI0036260083
MEFGRPGPRIEVPAALADSLAGADRQVWTAGLPALAEEFLDRWELRPDGPPAHGVVALVLPVLRSDGSPAVLKLQPVDEETRDEALALRTWGERHAAGVLDSDPDSGTLLLERLDAARSLATVPDDTAALQGLAELLAQLTAARAPAGLRRLADIARGMLDQVPSSSGLLADTSERRLLAACAAAVRDLLDEPGDRLLHWDLHYDNVLAPLPSGQAPGRSRWLAIDPKPLAGDPGFELLPALRNRWSDVVATGDVPRAVRRRFDLMTEVLGLDRRRAAGWTLGRVLQNSLWDIGEGAAALRPEQAAIALALLGT